MEMWKQLTGTKRPEQFFLAYISDKDPLVKNGLTGTIRISIDENFPIMILVHDGKAKQYLDARDVLVAFGENRIQFPSTNDRTIFADNLNLCLSANGKVLKESKKVAFAGGIILSTAITVVAVIATIRNIRR